MTAEFDDLTVCIAHGRFIPCRTNGEHRYTSNPYWVKSVRDYQGSPIEDLTWEPAWEHSTPPVRRCAMPEPQAGDQQCRWFGGTARPDLNSGCPRPAYGREGGLVLCDLHYEAAHIDPEDWTDEMREPVVYPPGVTNGE